MRSINRKSSPKGVDLEKYRSSNTGWNDLAKEDYAQLRKQLHGEFSGLCAFCERPVPQQRQPGPVEHFRPRNPATYSQVLHFGADLTFDWRNLMYACSDCQARKDNKWPGTLTIQSEMLIDWHLAQRAAQDGWTYAPVSADEGYVNPNRNCAVPAEDYFEYDDIQCVVAPSRSLPEDQRSKALRTIFDIGLDDDALSRERLIHIKEILQHLNSKGTRMRAQELDQLIERHRRRDLKDTKPNAYGPAVRFTGMVLFAAQEEWFQPVQSEID